MNLKSLWLLKPLCELSLCQRDTLKAKSLLNTHTKTKRAPHTPSRCSYHLPSKQCMKLDPHCSTVEPLHRLRLCKKADPTSHRALPAQCLWVLPKFMQGHAMGHWNATLAPSCATSKASQIPHWKSQRSSRYCKSWPSRVSATFKRVGVTNCFWLVHFGKQFNGKCVYFHVLSLANTASCQVYYCILLVLVPGNSTAHPLRTLLATPWDKTSQAPSNPASKASLLSSFSIAPVSKTSLKKCLPRSTCSTRSGASSSKAKNVTKAYQCIDKLTMLGGQTKAQVRSHAALWP